MFETIEEIIVLIAIAIGSFIIGVLLSGYYSVKSMLKSFDR